MSCGGTKAHNANATRVANVTEDVNSRLPGRARVPQTLVRSQFHALLAQRKTEMGLGPRRGNADQQQEAEAWARDHLAERMDAIAARYPVIGKPRVMPSTRHVGSLNPAHRKEWSLEGDGLSVSSEPGAWRRIAKIGGPEWELSRPDGQPLMFLDAHGLTKKERKAITDWAVENGYGEYVTAYTVTRWDDEWESNMTMTFATREEAEAETWDDDAIGTTNVFAFAPEHEPRGGSVGNAEDTLLPMWVEKETALDGVWWADYLDEDYLSAPRGVIPRSRLAGMTVTKVSD